MRSKPFGFHIEGTHQARPAATSSAAILDSRSVKTTDRGGHTATTVPSGFNAASATCWSTPLGLVAKVHVTADVGDRGPFLDWTRQRRGIAFQVMQHHDGGHKPRWLPAGATPPSCRRSW